MALFKVKLFVGFCFLFLSLSLLHPSTAQAQCLINIPDWSVGQVNSCLEGGSTVALVGSYGNFGDIYAQTAAIVSQYNSQQTNPDNRVTLEYRLYNDARPSTPQEIQSVIAIIQQNPINAPVMLRVNNEWTDAYVWPGMSYEERVSNYLSSQYAARQAIDGSGGGIVLVDGMLDYWSGVNVDQTINSINAQLATGRYPGWTRWEDTFDVLAINGYFEPGNFGQLGNYRLEQILSKLPPGKPWRFSEFGYKLPGGNPQYDNPQLLEQTIVGLFSWLANNPAYAQNFAGFNIFTRDPHISGSDNIASVIMEILERNPGLRSAMLALDNFGLQDPAKFQEWLKNLIKDGVLFECKDQSGEVIGYAPTKDQCQVPLAMPQQTDLACHIGGAQPTLPDKGDLRPAPCKNCKLTVPKPTNACAEGPALTKPATWTCGDLVGCPDEAKGRYWIKNESWGATFAVDTDEAKVPFAGYRDIETDDAGRSLNPYRYLTDYFDGTALYDKKPFNPQDPDQVNQLILEAGVFRKLAPLEIQDNLRKDMILKRLNYEVSDGKTTKQMQDWWPTYPFPPQPYPKGHFPPDKDDPNYTALYSEWLNSEWGRLWQRIPLFTREDSPGKIRLTVEHYPGQLAPAPDNQAGQPLTDYSAEFPLAVPHLARLYEASKNLHNLLIPTILKVKAQAAAPEETGKPTPCTSLFGEGIETALGCIPTTAIGVAAWFLHYGIFLGGGIAFLLMTYGALLFITAAADAEKIAQGKTIFIAALIGLLLIIGSTFLLQLIASRILKIPGFSQQPEAPNGQLTQSQDSFKGQNLLAAADAGIPLQAGSQKLLAQAEDTGSTNQSTCTEMNIIQTVDSQGQLHFGVQETLGDNVGKNCYYRDTTVTVTYSVDGTPVASCSEFHPVISNNPFDEYEEPLVSLCDPGLSVSQIHGTLSVQVNFFGGLMGGSGEECGGTPDSQAASCQCQTTFDASGKPTTTCQTGTAGETKKGCENTSNLKGSCSGNDPQEDTNPNDPICCSAKAKVDVPDYHIVAFKKYEDYEKACLCNPLIDEKCERDTVHKTEMARKIEVKLKLPYLKDIWEKSTDEEMGFFNLFRPQDWPAFPDDDALSNLRYELTDNSGVSITPETNLYFPYLGGIEQAKKCISEQFLLPKALQPTTNYCQFWEEYLKYSGFSPDQQSGFAVDSGTELDQMQCGKADFEISPAAKTSAIATANNSWPGNLLSEQWDKVVDQSRERGWNPACVVALWIEESGASGLIASGQAKYSLGCEGAQSHDPSTNLDESLTCFFSRQNQESYRNLTPGSRKWWLVYAEGPNNQGVFDGPQANFPGNLYSWYSRLSR